jgi:hypothetical protein
VLKIEKKLIYNAFGLSMISDIHLPELDSMANMTVDTDVEIKIEETSYYKQELESNPFQHFVIENEVLFNVPNIANFYIKDGKKIIVSPLDEADEDVLRLYILGTCMGTILMQRKILPLHGSAIEIDGKVYAIVGDSGAGKSTLASAFLKHGYKLVSDDVIAVSVSQENPIPYVTPAYPQQKLWQESLNMFGMENSNYRSIYGRENKYCIPVTESFVKAPLPLAGVFELVKSEETTHLDQLEKLESIHTLMKNTYRNFLIPRLGLMEWHFRTSASILEHIAMYRLHRSTSESSADQLALLILDSIRKKG